MSIKVLPQLRFLNPSLPVNRLLPLKFAPTSSPAIPIFSRIFPFSLKYSTLSPQSSAQPGFRRFSTRPFRSGGSGSSRGGRDRGEVRASKSLIEDEADLSDWAGDLRVHSSGGGRFSSEDGSDSPMAQGGRFQGGRGRGRGGENGRGRGGERGGRGRGGGRGGGRNGGDEDRFSMKRRRESDSDDFRESNPSSRGSSVGSFSRGGRGGSFSRGGRGGSFSRGGRGGSFSRNSGGNDRFDKGSRDSFGSDGGRFNSRGNVGSMNGKRGRGGVDFRSKRDAVGLMRRKEIVDDDENSENDDDSVSEVEEEEMNGLMGSLGGLMAEEESDDDEESDDGDDDGDVISKDAASKLGLEKKFSVKERPSSPEDSASYLSQTSFDQFTVSPLSLKGIKDAGYTKMTVVQEATLPVILKGKDVLAKAKTGTGKTVAFLLPSIEVVVKTPPADRDQKRPPILVLVMCPTRELASQAAAEAKKLLKYHPSIGVQVVIGGTRLALEQKRMQVDPCQILVATPGRLKDHIENTAGFATRMKGVKVLVLDEADHLLDMGFRKDIEHIIAAVPKQRQTLLFSATVPPEVRQICHVALKRDHEFINTVQEGSEETHAQVRQTHLVAPLDNQFALLYTLLKDHIADDVDYKVLVFCTTAMVTKLVADLLGELKMNVREIHSRKPQSYRTRVSDEFRKSKGLILVTSDVSARGVDYPDVTLVIQMGLPSDRQQYIHRLGRTGRKGKEGQGILLLAPWEQCFLSTIKDLPITKGTAPTVDPDAKKKVERALSNVEMKSKESAYQAWLGYYNSSKVVGRDKGRLVELANEFSRSMGLDNPPAIPKMILGKMGLRNVPGLRSK